MPGIDEYLEEQRKRLEGFSNFVLGRNRSKPAPAPAPAPSKKPSPFVARGNRPQDAPPRRSGAGAIAAANRRRRRLIRGAGKNFS